MKSCNHDAFLVIRYTVQKCALFHYPSFKPALKRRKKFYNFTLWHDFSKEFFLSQMHVSWSCILMLTNPLLVFIRSKMIINCTTCSLSIQTRAIEVRFGPQSALYRANPMLFLWSIKSYYRACWDGWTDNLPSGYNRGRLPRHTPPPLPLPTTSTQDVSYRQRTQLTTQSQSENQNNST